MPEPTTADGIDILRGKVERWAPQGVSDVMCSLADIADLLTAYDQQANEVDALCIGVSDQSKRAREAEARAAAAEAAVQRVRERAEAEYVRAINAVLASYRETADVQRWRGHAEALRQVAEQCCREQGVTIPAYGRDEWRQAHGVYSKELTDRWRAQAAGSTPAPTVRILAAEVPLGALVDLDDGQDATVTARVVAVRNAYNKSFIPTAYAEIDLADPDSLPTEDPDLWPVTVPPAVWTTAAYHLRVGEVVTVQIHQTTADNGVLHLFLVAVVPESGLEWTLDDEQHNVRRKAVAFEGAPPFTPVAASQFVSGLRATARAIETDQ